MGVTISFPTTTIEVFGTRSSVRIEAVIDTGFQGDLCLPAVVAESLGLVLNEMTIITLANGEESLSFGFAGEVELLGRRRPASIFVFHRDRALIGTELLADCQMVIDFPNKKVNLFRTEQTKTK